MPILEIQGLGEVEVGDEFLSLSPEQQNATVQEIAASAKPQPVSGSSFGGGKGVTVTPRQPPPEATMNPPQQVALDYMNQGSAASQRTTPNIAAQEPNQISADVHQNDAGEILYRDPRSGQLVPTDRKTMVGLRDPRDNEVKIFARTPSTDEGRLSAAGRLMGTGMAAGAVTARPGIAAAPAAAMQPRASELMGTAKPFYRAFKQEASQIKGPPEVAASLAERIRESLTSANLIPELAPGVYSAIGILEKGDSISLDQLQNIKRVVGRSFASPDKNVRDAASVASAEISKIIAEVSPSASKSLRTADDIHSTARSVQDLQRKSDVAGLRTGRAGYGGNAVNSMRQVLSPIVQKAIEGRMTGFKPDEIQAMREIVEGTTSTNALRGVGMFSPAKGSLASVGGLATGAGAGIATMGPVGIAGAVVLPALGAASNKLATILTGKQIERLKELVAKRSPSYADAVKKSVERYEKAQADFISDPSPSRFAAYLTVTRSLSSGLNRDGIDVTSGALMKALQNLSPARTDEDQ